MSDPLVSQEELVETLKEAFDALAAYDAKHCVFLDDDMDMLKKKVDALVEGSEDV